LVDLLSHLSHSIIVLLAQVGQCALMLDVGFLKVPAQFSKLGLPLLVQFDLGRSCASGFLETLSQFLQLAGEI